MVVEFRGTAVKAVKGASVTGDGEQVILGFETTTGEEMLLLMPSEAVNSLFMLAAQCTNQIDRRKGEESRTAFNVTRWRLAKDSASDHDVLHLTIGDEAQLAFRLPTRDPKEALAVISNTREGADPSKLN
jgi:hypothetical protein